jgi:hypothetical protein
MGKGWGNGMEDWIERLVRVDRATWFEHIGYKPHAGQRPVHESKARFKVHFAGSRMGKSLCAARDVEPMILMYNKRGWIVAPTYELGEKEFRYIWQDLIVRGGMPTERANNNVQTRDLHIRFLWGSEVKVKSADRPDSLLGEEVDWMIVAEAAQMSPMVWERYLRPRLTSRMGRAIFPTTPKGYNWVYDLWLRGGDSRFPEWESWQFPTAINPHVAPEEIAEAQRTLAPEVFREQYLGEPTSFAGLVYRNFDRDLNVIEHEYRDDWPTYCAVDFGYRMPAVLWIQEDAEGRAIIFDEFVEDNVPIEHLVDVIVNRGQRLEVRGRGRKYELAGLFCDPSGEGAQSSGLSDLAHLRAAGLNPRYETSPRWRSVAAGVALVRGLVCNAAGERRLFIARRLVGEGAGPHNFGFPICDFGLNGNGDGKIQNPKTKTQNSSKRRGVWKDIQRYSYPELRMDSSAVSDEPLKDGVSDHTMDALRYYAVNREMQRRNEGAAPRWSL